MSDENDKLCWRCGEKKKWNYWKRRFECPNCEKYSSKEDFVQKRLFAESFGDD